MLIYKATNLINNKVYIGQTTKTLEERMQYHLRDSARLDTYFYRAIRKYGWKNFKWEILEDNIQSEDELDEKEIYYIQLYDSFDNKEKGYNTQSGGRHFRVIEEECKARSERMKGELNPMYGKPGTWTGKKLSEEHKQKIRESLTGQQRPTTTGGLNPAARKIINLSNGEIFDCIKDACDKYHISHNALVNNICKRTSECSGCQWDYLENIDLKTFVPLVSPDYKPKVKRKNIYVLELDKTFSSAVAAAKEIGCDNSTIGKACKKVAENEYAIVKGFHIKYVNK